MAGHSKWANIKRRKAAADAKKSKVTTKVLREVQVAARLGGGDPAANPRLRLAIDKARQNNVPKDGIQRSIEKGTGAGGGSDWEDVVYEGYAPGGVAVVVECMTDNRNRTIGEVRSTFEKLGGKVGAPGSVSWMFQKRGVINVLKEAAGEEQLFEVVLEAGGDDVRDDGEVWTVETDPADYLAVREAIERAGIRVEHGEVDNIPETRVAVGEERAPSVLKLLTRLEDLDDVQNVYSNYEMADELLERYG